ncbi:hypothetical protein ACFQO1_04945 [Jejudonia soesokkakensis]|uniref:Import component protein n=1 Tax=Jejudonia soesokkakensis TaxID=1323432 RepID=A0ABW2MSZ9_9FLAO
MVTTPPGKNKAIIAYITFIGMFIAISMNKDHKDSFASWHIKNMFGLVLMLFVAVITQFHINLLAGDILYWISVVFWLFSFIMAIANKQQGIPFLSEQFQKWFKFLD